MYVIITCNDEGDFKMKLIVFFCVTSYLKVLVAACLSSLLFNLQHVDVMTDLHISHCMCDLCFKCLFVKIENYVTHVNHTALIYSIAYGLCQGAGL